MLSNAYFLAKFRFDTAENEPAKNLQNFAKFARSKIGNRRTLLLAQRCPIGHRLVALVGLNGRLRVPARDDDIDLIDYPGHRKGIDLSFTTSKR